MRAFLPLLLLSGFAFSAAPALADDVSESISQAAKAYEEGDLAGAKEALDTASQMIGEKRAAELMKALPAALEGWKAEEGESQAMAAAFMGGGTTVTRRYAKGDESLEMTIVIDSPMIMSFAGMLSNPAVAGSMGKTIKIGKQKAIISDDGQLQMVVANRALVTIQGSGSADSKKAYAEKIDFKAIENF